jgi:4-coumarate--CoA ligase
MRADEGNRLKAFIVAKDDRVDLIALRAQIDAWAAEHLSTPEIPRALCFGRALPRDAQGKLTDWVIDPGESSMLCRAQPS